MFKKLLFTFCVATPLFALKAQVVGGEVAQAEEYPWMVTLITDNGMQGCGASLIAPQWVLTAGHCDVDFPNFPENEKVLINALVTDASTIEPFSELIEIEEIIVHEDYSIFGGGPDIALIRLAEPATISPVALAEFTDSAFYSHQMPGKVLGWGKTETNGDNSDSLLIGNLYFIDSDTCSALYSNGQDGNPFDDDPYGLLCAGFLTGTDTIEVGAAQGDSGGPLFFEDNGTYKQVGIVSRGEYDVTTVDFPGIFTFIPQHRNWIDSTMLAYENAVSVESLTQEDLEIIYAENGKIQISNLYASDDYSLELIDNLGRLRNALHPENGNAMIDFQIDNLATGIYILIVENQTKGIVTSKKISIHR
jgi:secreted trypsin-like serine protease